MLNYLLNQYSQEGKVVAYPLWNSDHLAFILRGVIEEQWLEGIDVVLKGNCAHHLYLSMDYYQRLDFIGDRIGQHMSSENKDIKLILMNICCDFPYAGLALGFLSQDIETSPKLLEKCLSNISIDDLEMLYIYDIKNIPETIVILRERDIDKELIKSVFSEEDKGLRDKD